MCMKKNRKQIVLNGISEVYGLMQTPDYAHFVVQGGASQLMRENWIRLGGRMNNSVTKVISEHGRQKKAA